MNRIAIPAAATTLSTLTGCATTSDACGDAAALHARILTLDTHLDTPLHFARPGWSFADRHDLATDLAQLDIPRMQDGALDGRFFVTYTEQGQLTAKGYADALAFARARSDLLDTTLAKHPHAIGTALTGADARRPNQQGKLIAFKSIENSYPLGEDVSLLAEFHAKGVRMAGPVHSKNNQFADSATDTPRWNGLSPLGRRWVAEMNRLGMVMDASHSSDAAFDQLLDLPKHLIILSHSSLRSANDHQCNLDEGRLRALAAKGGAMCVSTIFLSKMNMTPARRVICTVRTHRHALACAAGRSYPALAPTRSPRADVGCQLREVHRHGAALDRGRGTRAYLLRRRLGWGRRACRNRGHRRATQDHRTAQGGGLFGRRHREDVERQRVAHLGGAG